MPITKKEMESWTHLTKEQIVEQSARCERYIKTFDIGEEGVLKFKSELASAIEKEEWIDTATVEKMLDDADTFIFDANRAIYQASHIVHGDPFFWRGELESKVDERVGKEELLIECLEYMVKMGAVIKAGAEKTKAVKEMTKVGESLLKTEESVKEMEAKRCEFRTLPQAK